ncbi:MAG: hypothetical protein LJE84_04875 [Gammaproteobacteria bacterium]|nr:hypothetical protein [Gammaproteobacteria bacterium]
MKESKTVDFDIDFDVEPGRSSNPFLNPTEATKTEKGPSRFGPERRTGERDRRSGNDRRDSIRMGEDRRQNRGRRDYDQDVWDLQKKAD